MIKSKIEFDKDKMIAWLKTRSDTLEQIRALLNDDAVKYAIEHKQYSFVYEMAGDRYIRFNQISAVLLLAGIDDLLDNIGDTIYTRMFSVLPIKSIKVPFNIKHIGLRAFSSIESLEEVYLPDLDSLNLYAFIDCNNLDQVYIDSNKDKWDEHFLHAIFPGAFEIDFNDGVMKL